ncbi:hypothetical protein ACQZF5_05165 [Corynebacterium diphtheriae]
MRTTLSLVTIRRNGPKTKKEHEMSEETKELTELAAAVGVYQEETRARKIAEWVYDASTVFAGIATFYLVLMMVAMWS